MTAALLRVSVVAGSRRLDLAVPPALPVAELVPGLARHLGVVSYDGLRLCTATGGVLDERAGLATQDVPDGAVLTLAPPPPPPPVHDDPAEALPAAAPPAEPPRWWPLPAAAVLLALGALALATAHGPHGGRTAAAVALLLLAGGLAAARAEPAVAVVASLGAAAYAALAAARLVADLRPGPGVAWAAAGGAVLAVGSLAMTGLPSYRLLMLPALVIGTAAAAVGAVLSVRDVPLAVPACVLLALGAVVTGAAPWLAAGRISRPRGRVDVAVLTAEARTARELLLGLTLGVAVVHVALVPLVAAHGPFGMALAACGSAFVLLRCRHPAAPAPALAGLVAGGLGLVATAGVALAGHPAWRPPGAVLLVGVAGVLLASLRLGDRRSLLLPVLLRALETACLVAVVPLVVLATGVLARLS